MSIAGAVVSAICCSYLAITHGSLGWAVAAGWSLIAALWAWVAQESAA